MMEQMLFKSFQGNIRRSPIPRSPVCLRNGLGGPGSGCVIPLKHKRAGCRFWRIDYFYFCDFHILVQFEVVNLWNIRLESGIKVALWGWGGEGGEGRGGERFLVRKAQPAEWEMCVFLTASPGNRLSAGTKRLFCVPLTGGEAPPRSVAAFVILIGLCLWSGASIYL